MSDGMNRRTEEPQRTDDPRADAEWKANPGLENLVHGADKEVSPTCPILVTLSGLCSWEWI